MTFALRPDDFYHTGIVVSDLDDAMARLSALAGDTWIAPMSYTLPFRTAAGTRELTSTFVYSLQSPHVELIQEVPDSPWTAPRGNAIHHLGYFTDDLTATARALEDMGVYGVKTTIPYYLEILQTEEFRAGTFDTSFVEEHPELVDYATSRPTREMAAVIAAAIAAYTGN